MSLQDANPERIDPRTAEFLRDIQDGYGDTRPDIEPLSPPEASKRVGEVALDGIQAFSGRIDDGYGDKVTYAQESLPFHFQLAFALNNNHEQPGELD